MCIPDAHFLSMRSSVVRGGRGGPDVSATVAKADNWLHTTPGPMSVCAVARPRAIVSEGLVDETFMRSYTDGALLALADNGKRLRQSDLLGTKVEPDRFVVWDEQSAEPVVIPIHRLWYPDRGHAGAAWHVRRRAFRWVDGGGAAGFRSMWPRSW